MATLSSKLRELGITYKQYLQSDHWLSLRERYYRIRPKECWVCGAKTGIQLHHMTYDRLGEERISDLAPLCDAHHDEFHKKNPGFFDLKKRSKKYITQTSRSTLPDGLKRIMNGKVRLRSKSGNGMKRFIGSFKTVDEALKARTHYKRHDQVAKAKTISLDGPKCKRCGEAMAVVCHPPSWSPTPNKAYYKYWYKCTFKKCRTGVVMPPEAYIRPTGNASASGT